MAINPILQYFLDELHQDPDIKELSDNQFYVGLLRDPISLTAPHYTRIGIEYVSESGDGTYYTQLRDWDETKVQIKLTVVTSYGHNENHCRDLVKKISELFVTNRKRVTSTYKIYVDKISSNIVETEQARWVGTINYDVSYLTPVIENL